MIPVNKALMGILAVQIGLAVFTWLPGGDSAPPAVTLVDYGADAITRLEIVGRMAPDMDAPPDPIVLEKSGESWSLTSSGGFPAKTDAVQSVLDGLGEVTVRAPIGTTAGAHAALQVAEDQFTRKITLGTPDASTTLFLGAATGASMQVRRDGEAEVYQLRGVTAWSVPDSQRRFYDTDYVKGSLNSVTSLRIKNAQGDHTLVRMGGAWSSEELENPSDLNADEADALARTLLSVRISEPVGKQVLPEHGLDGTVRVEFTALEEDVTAARGYTVGALIDDGKRYVKSDDSEWVVAVLDSNVVRAVETDFKFLEGAPPEEADNQPPGGFFGEIPPGR
ncbi:MAG: hypothetical protein ACI8PZ_002002 [Myxococcota bacterium]|jgi:hypothetical protein